MRYVLRQKLLSREDDFFIRTDHDQDVFFVDGKSLRAGDQLSFQDLTGRELAYVKHKVFARGRTFEIYRNGMIEAVVKEPLFTLEDYHFTVEKPRKKDLGARGDFPGREYTFQRGERVVATVSKTGVKDADAYGVEIPDGEDDVYILAAAVVIDELASTKRRART
jgi:uncharacterized protein YxjI